RIVFGLATPFVLRTPNDAAAWKLMYQRWCCYLAREFTIVADPSCADWSRLYRLPHATRDEGGQPEQLEAFGNIETLGTWNVTPSKINLEADAQIASTLSQTSPLWLPIANALEEEVRQSKVRQGGEGARNGHTSQAHHSANTTEREKAYA